jgi:hypothetical protein
MLAPRSHAAVGLYGELLEEGAGELIERWEDYGQAKVALKVDTEQELLDLQAQVRTVAAERPQAAALCVQGSLSGCVGDGGVARRRRTASPASSWWTRGARRSRPTRAPCSRWALHLWTSSTS